MRSVWIVIGGLVFFLTTYSLLSFILFPPSELQSSVFRSNSLIVRNILAKHSPTKIPLNSPSKSPSSSYIPIHSLTKVPLNPPSTSPSSSFIPTIIREIPRILNKSTIPFKECAREYFGDVLLLKWSEKKESYCIEGDVSTFYCYPFLQFGRGGPDNFCEFTDGFFSDGLFQIDCALKPGKNQEGSPTRLSDYLVPERYIPWSPKLNFLPTPKTLSNPLSYFPPPRQESYMELIQNFHSLRNPKSSPPLSLNETSIWSQLNHTVIFVHRDCHGPPFNPFHCFTSIVDAFQTIVQFNLLYDDVSFVFFDHSVPGPFLVLWQALGSRYMTFQEWSLNPEPVQVHHGILLQTSSFIWTEFWSSSKCPFPSPLLQEFRTYMSLKLPLLIEPSIYSNFTLPLGKTMRITIPIRTQEQGGHRYLSNMVEMVSHLESVFPSADIFPILFHSLPFNSQVALMFHTDILLGVHGGAMSNMLFLQNPKGKVLEFHPQSSVAYCYENMAKWSGIPYRALPVDDANGVCTVNVDQVASLIQELVMEG